MKRNMIEIDRALCNGCGQCVTACAEGALKIVDGKAQLISDSYCDGLGACIGHCPQGAIKIISREALPFNEPVVAQKPHCACPGSKPRNLESAAIHNWPIQIALVPEVSDCFAHADLLIAADCVAFSYAHFHEELLQGKKLLIGCPKLDNADFYMEKLSRIFQQNPIKSITVARMEVPCCKGLSLLVMAALKLSKANIPYQEVIISVDGQKKDISRAVTNGGFV